ncbi:Hsp70 protein that interacts with Zuo1p [Spiromyces aspiralis]|uniref:Hsp70 protein that interacts with Zuo1p n=1 Tax=Spiromyces aspiralis TaxID=68401 RepID=A0ACC1HYZ9_9FUNG|nr:Hsp70 protein that interacts with Zuo1p [Spiromyces aspiralis]
MYYSDVDIDAFNKASKYSSLVKADGNLAYKISVRDHDGNVTDKPVPVRDAAVKYLRGLVQSASSYIGKKVDGAVLAVPTYFTAEQRKALVEVCRDAEIPILQMISEPAAAALSYNLDKGAMPANPQDTTVMVVDVGGSSTDVSIMAVRGGLFVVVGTKHLKEVSGDAMDELLVSHFAEEFKRKTQIDILGDNDRRAIAKLKQACEITKRTLSSAATAPCSVESLSQGVDFTGSINRIRFNIRTAPLYRVLVKAIESLMEECGYTANEIDRVLFVGGAARVPKLQSEVETIFPEGRTEVLSAPEVGELDELIAEGCAMQASLITAGRVKIDDEGSPELDQGIAAPALSKTVGLRLAGDLFLPVVLRDTPVPVSRSVTVSVPPGEAVALFSIYEGTPKPAAEPADDENEEEDAGNSDLKEAEHPSVLMSYTPGTLLGEMTMKLPESAANANVTVEFFVDKQHGLTVTATEVSTKSEAKLKIV